MRKLSLSLAAVLAAMVVATAPVGAITYGQPDAGEHPYVGFMIFYEPAEDAWFSCSGTLLDADTLPHSLASLVTFTPPPPPPSRASSRPRASWRSRAASPEAATCTR